MQILESIRQGLENQEAHLGACIDRMVLAVNTHIEGMDRKMDAVSNQLSVVQSRSDQAKASNVHESLAEVAQGRRRARPVYRMPYPDHVDAHELPRNYRYPDFSMYYGEENFFTVQHIARFTAQCGEAGPNPWLRMRLFSCFLAGAAFEWYSTLLANNIQTWDEMEEAFHTQFYQIETEATLADISRLSQLSSESVETFVAMFKKAKLKCRVSLPEPEYIKLALNGLDIKHRKRFDRVEFQDLFDLADRASLYEEILKEKKEGKNSSKGTYYKDPNYKVFSVKVGDEFEVNVAEVNIKKPYICEALVKPKPPTGDNATSASTSAARKGVADIGKNYSFDLSKTDKSLTT
ncbi:uncharacterized protein LOC132301442 [Cornus florida]|uniref:uncharacterized protein LOC132301442 n=1 Tax=Cornus florida TaxID=4283 RepID=UPI0028A0577E|nr:uncharacterized protein LOC132301442 [Cornus florida]